MLTLSNFEVATLSERLQLETKLVLETGHILVASFFIDVDDHVRREVDNLLEIFRSHVEQVAETARNTLEVPDVGDWRCEFDVAHALTTHRRLGHLNATAFTDDALVAHTLVLAT